MADLSRDPAGRPACSKQWLLTQIGVWPSVAAFLWGAWNLDAGVMASSLTLFSAATGLYLTRRHLHNREVKA